jgi:hypothetical protein
MISYLNDRLKDLKKEDFAVGPIDISDIDETLYPSTDKCRAELSLESMEPNKKRDMMQTEDEYRPSNVYVLVSHTSSFNKMALKGHSI